MKSVTLSSIAVLMAAFASTSVLADTAKDYNLFLLGNLSTANTDTEGRIAVGGNANIANYAVAANLTSAADNQANLVVGKALTFNSGQVYHGDIVAGSSLSLANVGLLSGSASVGALPVDFAKEKSRLLTLTQTLAADAATGTTVDYYNGLTFTGTNTGLNVFDLSGAELARASSFTINIPAGAFALFNIDGTADSMQNFGFFGQTDATHLLFNFADATSLSLAGVGVPGTILAPTADITAGYLNINGTVIANSLTGNSQINYYPYAGTLLDAPTNAVPEPAAWTMMILGVGLTGAVLRGRRRRAMA